MTHEEPHRQHYNITLSVLVLGGITFSLLQSLVLPALPTMQKDLHTSVSSVAWVLTAYLLSASVATPILGRLGDMFGKEKMLMASLIGLAIGTFLAAIATNISLMIVARAIQGIGAGIFPLAFGIIRDEFPRDKVAGCIGLMSALLGVGGGLGVVFAGPIIDNLNYHWLFWLPLIGILVCIVMTHFFIPESPIKTPASINWLGAFLMSAGLTAVLVAISEATVWGWGSPKTIGLTLVGLVILGAWIWAELRAKSPLVDMRMMQIKGVWTTNLVAFLLGVGMYSSFILIPEFVQLPKSTGFGFGASLIESGLFLLPATLAMVVVGQFAGRLEKRFGSKPPLIAGSLFTSASFLVLVVAHSQKWEIYVSTLFLGLGIGLAFAAMANLIVQAVPQNQTGVATGMNTVLRSLGGAMGGQIAASFLAGNVIAATGLTSERGFQIAFIFCAVALLLSVGVGFLIPGRQLHAAAEAERLAPIPAAATEA